MVDILHTKCISCNLKLPSCKYPNEQQRLYCASCELENMVDIMNKKCITCDFKQPNFNSPNEEIHYLVMVERMRYG